MALVGDKLKSKMQSTLEKSLKEQFAKDSKDNPKAEEMWKKMAAAIAEIAVDIVQTIQQDAEVAAGISLTVNPGIPTAGSPAAQTTVGPGTGLTTAPGKIL
jgi:predicted NBD/HSP70 family sugar kinase